MASEPDPTVHVASGDVYARAGIEGLLAREGFTLGDREVAEVLVWDAAGGPPMPLGERVVALVVDEESAEEALSSGALAVVPRGADGLRIGAAIRAVAAGLLALDAEFRGLLGRRRPAPAVEKLTTREVEVLHLLAEGLSNKQIAARLHVSEHTAKFHVVSILGKLGAGSRTEAVVVAARSGMLML